MNYQETLNYLFLQLPMYHRIGAAAYKADLNNTIALAKVLDNPEKKFRSVHIAGTNGKGSTSHLLAAILQCAGYKTGLYTSPHLADFRERIRINGEMIPENSVTDFVARYKSEFEKIQLSFFEWTVGLAFDYFANEKTDIAIIETGLGGRLDSTNIITPLLSVITNISMDHTQLLGDTPEKIAAEKAGIIKPGIPVVIGERQKETGEVFIEKAAGDNSKISFASDELHAERTAINSSGQTFNIISNGKKIFDSLYLELPGHYQEKNILTVLLSVLTLNNSGWNISEKNIRDGCGSVRTLTGLSGRWQVLGEKPLIICDVGHNTAGIEFILKQISETPFAKLHFVFGVVNDKDVSGILHLLPANAIYYFCKANIPRSLDENILKEEAGKFSLQGESYHSVSSAINSAKQNASADDLIFIGGSTFVVAEALSM